MIDERRAGYDPDMLARVGVALASKRDEAKAARASSGIELVWNECEEAYAGIDDANRGEMAHAKWSKPMSVDGPIESGRNYSSNGTKSTVFVRLTARYVDAGAAKVGEILLPTDDKAFSFTETPVPELVEAKEDESQVVHDGMGNIPLMRQPKPDELPPSPAQSVSSLAAPAAPVPPDGAVLPGGAGGAPPMVPLTVKDLAEENIELARKKAKAAEKRIHDWMIECNYTAEVRKVIFDSARIGVGVLKAPYPKPSRSIASRKSGGGEVEVQIVERVRPAAKWVDPWNIFPDPACGERIVEGSYVFERDYLSERQVMALKKVPGYIGDQIEKVLEEGPGGRAGNDERQRRDGKNKGRYEVWYYYGDLSPEDMDCICDAMGRKAGAPRTSRPHVIATMIGDCVVRAVENPLDSGAFPYHAVSWQRRCGSWAGIGVAEQVDVPQKIVNAATRAMLDNAGISAGVQLVINQSAIVPADGSAEITRNKVWYKTGDSVGDDVRKDMMAIEFPNATTQLMSIIQYGMQLAEESTSIPLVTQGQSGPTTPDTFGAAQLQNSNANQLLRSIGYSFDDYVTEPVVRQFYEWLLLDPEVPDDEKGDFTISAQGSVALVERAIQDQTLAQMAPLTLNPAYGLSPKKWAEMFVKSKRIDPKGLQNTEEEQAKIDSAGAPPAPAVQVAEIKAKLTREAMAAEMQTGERESATESTLRLHEMQIRKELALLDYANREKISLDRVKADLAKTSMTLNMQRELSGEISGQVAAPKAEPPLRAVAGRAFEQ